MILVDDRTGSKELAPLIQALSVPAFTTRLESGDFQFEGNGPAGPLLVGLERKTIPDLIDSMTSKRYAGHQLPTFVKWYKSRWLIVEGPHRCGANGGLEVPHGRGQWGPPYGHGQILHRQVDNFLSSSQMLHGVCVKYTSNPRDTAQAVVNLYWWWQKAWEDHSSHRQLYTPQTHVTGSNRMSVCRAWAASLNKATIGTAGIGYEKSAAVEAHFKGNAMALANATRDQWRIPGVVGDKLSLIITTAIRGRVELTDDIDPASLVLPESLVPAIEPVLDVTVADDPEIVW